MSFHISSRLKFLQLSRISCNLQSKFRFCNKRSYSTGVSKKIKLEDYFFDKRVQSILKKITNLDYDKVFRTRKQEIVTDKFEFVTEKQLKEMYDSINAKASEKLQMPPVMNVREAIDEVLSKDPELQFYLDTKLVFIDTSSDRTSRNRIMTVRETDGTLRKADWDERFRMNQIFFPIHGRNIEKPKLFESPYLEKLLDEESYEFILDAACVQFEPDDPEYHRVTNSTYECIKSMKKFDALRSTRHFGPMAFFFAVKKDINSLLVDMVERQLIGDAADTIRLMHILNPNLETSQHDKEMSNLEYVQAYVEKNKSLQTADLELALQTFIEIQSKADVENVSL